MFSGVPGQMRLAIAVGEQRKKERKKETMIRSSSYVK